MENLLGTNSKSLPPGFRFHPTDEELLLFYLKRKVMGKSLHPKMISEVKVYGFVPWDLPDMSCMKSRDLSWYYFCPRSEKYAHGGRTNRSNESGYWKSTGNDRTIQCNRRNVGKIRTLIFHLGKAPKGERTDWVIHEYRLEDSMLADKGVLQNAYVLCKLYRKSGLGPKNGEHYGAPFIEEEWESDGEDNLETRAVSNNGGGCEQGDNQSGLVTVTTTTTTTTTPTSCSTVQQQVISDPKTPTTSYVESNATITPTTSTPVGEMELEPIQMEEDEIERMLAMFSEDGTANLLQGNATLEPRPEPDIDIYHGLEDLAGTDGFQTTTQVGSSWSQFIAENADYYMELNDLNRV